MSILPSFRSLIRYPVCPSKTPRFRRSSLNRRLSLLNSALRILDDTLRDLPLMLGRLLRLLWERAILNTLMIREDAPNLGSPDAEQEEIHRSQAVVAEIKSAHSDPASLCVVSRRGRGDGVGNVQDVPRLDDEAPACPDRTGCHQGEVLGQGERLGGAREVGYACEHDTPLSRHGKSAQSCWGAVRHFGCSNRYT